MSSVPIDDDTPIEYYKRYPMNANFVKDFRTPIINFAKELGIFTDGCIQTVGRHEQRVVIVKISGPLSKISRLSVFITGMLATLDNPRPL